MTAAGAGTPRGRRRGRTAAAPVQYAVSETAFNVGAHRRGWTEPDSERRDAPAELRRGLETLARGGLMHTHYALYDDTDEVLDAYREPVTGEQAQAIGGVHTRIQKRVWILPATHPVANTTPAPSLPMRGDVPAPVDVFRGVPPAKLHDYRGHLVVEELRAMFVPDVIEEIRQRRRHYTHGAFMDCVRRCGVFIAPEEEPSCAEGGDAALQLPPYIAPHGTDRRLRQYTLPVDVRLRMGVRFDLRNVTSRVDATPAIYIVGDMHFYERPPDEVELAQMRAAAADATVNALG